ncbi:4-hydroxythreonine-4-phosphate dehydrogenase (plasmid) [Caballeronia sp. SBC1]|uniref:4-hydroxythreonine-4-phosphate dehydrogenase PdxA n=1 Tax=unclassified Caballeronia TaxID=2646786 RepID=UPI0013E11A91|nr:MULTISPECIES: 4-hydroxythreonine-4-phosphate dehydrogenase PdxA [unclassified Caballeronia]QIE30161.1 4-hydroxythreonine-4-phosphate dehydrogenase [Caballeronia sp. SBC2]QIN67516.1 4-hydroxythreonine-4-phosphate dehydrogenase [Caballeronia sp. SBC1]
MTHTSADGPKLLIFGDDLSGTADCAVTGASLGLESVVMFDAHMARTLPEGIDVLAIDLDCRRSAPEVAARANADAWQALRQPGRRLYKKIDSTLRGNFAAEVAALVPLAGMAIVAPAFPAAGRTTRDARQWLHGAAVESSEVWRNEGIAGRADLAAMLAQQDLRVGLLTLDAVRGDPSTLAAQISAARADGMQVLVCDSETNDDLRRVARASASLDGVFWVGSAGLARDLMAALELTAAGGRTHAPSLVCSPVLTVVGSMSSISHSQVAMLKAVAGNAMLSLELTTESLRREQPELTAVVIEALSQGRDVIVSLKQDDRAHLADGLLFCQRLAALLAPAVPHAASVIATGGETARTLLAAAGISALRVVDEIESGVPLLHAAHAGRTLHVITKAGGFGTPGTLTSAWRRLAGGPRADARPSHQGTTAMTYRPVIGITMGDAAGVGPEIIMKSLAHESVYAQCRPLVIGDSARLRDAARRSGVSLDVRSIERPADAEFRHGVVDCIDLGLIPADLPYGKLSAIAGDAAYQYIARTVELTSAGELDAICTAPLNKEALHAGGHIFPGHTEMLAHLTGIDEVSMMLVAPKLRVIHVTTHIGLLDAIRRIEPGLVQRTIERAHETLTRAGIGNPRIGVCGINPHAGENGLFGYGEEEEKIMPAIAILQARGWNVEGPLPADTLFFRAGRGDFDVVVAMYHDQGHGPVKVMGLEAGVNVTVGLPVIRTSVDHGTAFDIAGTGIADERSMLEALRQAQELATRLSAHKTSVEAS